MEKTICEFCSHGEEVENICGKLHVEKVDGGKKQVSAHHKCMQYSAELVQYKFDHFGGFKITKVESEIKRGRFLACTICKKEKAKKGRLTRRGKLTGATAGCAIKSCRKTFHFYCAKIDPVAVTKRLLVKRGKNEVILYRVFCCNTHLKAFKADKANFASSHIPTESNSDEEEDDENDDDQKFPPQDSCNTQQTDDMYFLDETTVSPQRQTNYRKQNSRGDGQNSPHPRTVTALKPPDEKMDKANENGAMGISEDEEFDHGYAYDSRSENLTEHDKSLNEITSSTPRKAVYQNTYSPPGKSVKKITSLTPGKPVNQITSSSPGKSVKKIISLTPRKPVNQIISSTARKPVNQTTSSTPEKPVNQIISSTPEKPVNQITSSTPGKSVNQVESSPPEKQRKVQTVSEKIHTVSYCGDSVQLPVLVHRSPRKSSGSSTPHSSKRKSPQKQILRAESDSSDKSELLLSGIQKIPDNKSEKDNESDGSSSLEHMDKLDESLLSQAASKNKNVVVTKAVINTPRIIPKARKDVEDDDTSSLAESDDDSLGVGVLNLISSDEDLDNHEVDSKPVASHSGRYAKQNLLHKTTRLNKNNSMIDMTENKNAICPPRRCASVVGYSEFIKSNLQESGSYLDEDKKKNYPDCCLILTNTKDPPPALRKKLREKAKETFGVHNVAFWLDDVTVTELTAAHIPYVIGEIARMIQEEDYVELSDVLSCKDPLLKLLENLKYMVTLGENIDENIVKEMKKAVFKKIPKFLDVDDKMIMVKDNPSESLLIKLCPILDEKGEIRHATCRSCFEMQEMYEWKEKTVAAISIGENQDELQFEKSLIYSWLISKLDAGFEFKVLPNDDVLLQKKSDQQEDYLTKQIWEVFEGLSTSDRQSSSTLAVRINAMDGDVVNVLKYCQRTIKKWCSEKYRDIFFIIDIHPSNELCVTRRHLMPDSFFTSASCKILSAFNPRKKGISCIIVHFCEDDDKKQISRIDAMKVHDEISKLDSSDEDSSSTFERRQSDKDRTRKIIDRGNRQKAIPRRNSTRQKQRLT